MRGRYGKPNCNGHLSQDFVSLCRYFFEVDQHNVIESEEHVLFNCPLYNTLRGEFMPALCVQSGSTNSVNLNLETLCNSDTLQTLLWNIQILEGFPRLSWRLRRLIQVNPTISLALRNIPTFTPAANHIYQILQHANNNYSYTMTFAFILDCNPLWASFVFVTTVNRKLRICE